MTRDASTVSRGSTQRSTRLQLINRPVGHDEIVQGCLDEFSGSDQAPER